MECVSGLISDPITDDAKGLVARLAVTGCSRPRRVREAPTFDGALGFEKGTLMVGSFDPHDIRARHARTLIQVADELGDRFVSAAWVRERAKWRDRHADILGADALYDFHDYIQERIEAKRVRESQPRWWTLGRPRKPHTTDLLISAEALLLRADELLEP